MAPETRSKKFYSSCNDELENDTERRKRRKWLPFDQESCFLSKSCMERYHSRFKYGEIVPGRFADLGFFDKEGFRFGKWFQDLNWVSVVSMKEKFYPELVKHFYANLSYDSDKTHISSFVNGKEIGLNAKCLMQILGIPNAGSEIYGNDNNAKWLGNDIGVSRLESFRTILENSDLSQVSLKFNACQLKLEMRLLHHMVVHILLPRKRDSNYVSDMDLLVMWHIVKGKAFNLPFLLLSHMIACSEKKSAYLPYGMMLTLIFKHFEVSLEEEDGKEMKGSDFYNEVTLHKMGYVRGEKGWFLKKDKAVAQPSSVIQSPEEVNASENHDSAIRASSLGISSLPNSTSVPNPPSPVSALADFVFSAEEGRTREEEAKRPTVIQVVLLLVRGLKEDMRAMTIGSKLDELQSKFANLRLLVTELGFKPQEKTIGDIFLLLECIIGDMRNLHFKLDTFGNKVGHLLTRLNKFLGESPDLSQVERDCIELMVTETITFQGHNRDILSHFETLRSEVQDFWDCLSSRM